MTGYHLWFVHFQHSHCTVPLEFNVQYGSDWRIALVRQKETLQERKKQRWYSFIKILKPFDPAVSSRGARSLRLKSRQLVFTVPQKQCGLVWHPKYVTLILSWYCTLVKPPLKQNRVQEIKKLSVLQFQTGKKHKTSTHTYFFLFSVSCQLIWPIPFWENVLFFLVLHLENV